MKTKITVDEVRKAYIKTNTVPVKGIWLCSTLNKCKSMGVCALTVQYMVQNNITCEPNSDDVEEWAVKKYGKFYKNGFITGFDNGNVAIELEHTQRNRERQNVLTGYREGKRIAKYIFNKKLKANRKLYNKI